MQINKINSLNFNANFVCNTQIKKLINKEIYSDYNAYLLEINEKNIKDIGILKEAANKWQKNYNSRTFLDSIITDIHFRQFYPPKYKSKTYILSSNPDINNQKANDILGVAEFTQNEYNNTLNYLQVNPQYISKYKQKKEFKGIGKAIINFLKTISDKSIELEASKSSQGFYKKQGFKYINNSDNEYLWEK